MANDPLYEERLKKMNKLKALGINPYPEKFEKTHFSTDATAIAEEGVREIDEIVKAPKNNITLAGRIVLYRSFGKLTFATIQDDMGRIQISFMLDNLSDKTRQVVDLLDLGDFIGVTGEMFKTKHGESTLYVDSLTFLGKALRPLPEKFHGIKDTEAKYRQRYLDLATSRETRERFNLRSLLVRKVREFYWSEGFTEIETPVLENTSSGAISKPFTTHHNALDIDVYLRIAGGELWLKEAVVGGFEKVFEIGKVFRNEGIDPSHLQEFTMVEHYAAYWNFEKDMEFTEKMFQYLLTELFGTTKVTIVDRDGKPAEIDFKAPWPREDYVKLIEKDCGIDVSAYSDEKTLLKAIQEKGIEIDGAEKLGYGNLIDHLYKKVTRPKLVQPTFVMNHPKDTKPLARINDTNPAICDTYQLLVNGWEIVNAYSELVDPSDQRSRFENQAKARAKGDDEAMEYNEDYLTALEHGAPPISGFGMGIDRLITLLTQQENLKDLVMFPIMKPNTSSTHVGQSSTPSPTEQGFQTESRESDTSSTQDRQADDSVQQPVQDVQDVETGLNFTQAYELAEKHIKNPATFNHSKESAAVLRGLAKHFGKNEEQFAILGLLHDIDWDPDSMNPAQHGLKSEQILSDAGMSPEGIDIIKSHVYGLPIGPWPDKQRSRGIENALAAGETVTGLIHAYALVRPTKNLEGAKVKSIVKKFKDKSFAAGVDRTTIMECEKIGIDLNQFLQIALDAIQEIAADVGL